MPTLWVLLDTPNVKTAALPQVQFTILEQDKVENEWTKKSRRWEVKKQ